MIIDFRAFPIDFLLNIFLADLKMPLRSLSVCLPYFTGLVICRRLVLLRLDQASKAIVYVKLLMGYAINDFNFMNFDPVYQSVQHIAVQFGHTIKHRYKFSKFFRFLPFPYAVNAVRETVMGMYENDLWIYLVEVLLFFGVALLFGMYMKRPFAGVREFLEEKQKETGVM